MTDLKFIKPEKINLKNHPDYNEKWIQDHIVDDPSLLGLGDDVIVKDEERHQPHAGRLDLLLQDSQNLRYEVEIQLGKVEGRKIIISRPTGIICTTAMHSRRTCFGMVVTTCHKEEIIYCIQSQE